MSFVSATAECPHCPVKKHQIDCTEERALEIVRRSLDAHISEAHPGESGGVS